MAKIKLVETGWSMIPEGDYVFKVDSVDYKEDYGKLEINLLSQSGQKHQERYSLTTGKGKMNEGAYKAFSFFAKTALNNFNLDEIDPDDLVGCYVSATVEHEGSVDKDGEPVLSDKTGEQFVNARLRNLANAVGFGKKSAKEEVDEDDDFDAAVDEVDEDNIDDLDDWLDD